VGVPVSAGGRMDSSGTDDSTKLEKKDRCFRKASLMGMPFFEVTNGIRVTIYKRAGKFIGRGRYDGHQFGQLLGETEREAQANLHRLLYELEQGTFVPPSKKNRQIVRSRISGECLETRDLVNRFLQYIQNEKGRPTQRNYLDRLRPVLEFVEQTSNKRRWSKASSIDHDFVVELRNWLNSSPFKAKNGKQKHRTAKTVRNILECLRTCLNWAIKPERFLLPPDFVMPVTTDLVGNDPPKDPFRPNPLTIEQKIRIVQTASDQKLAVIALSLILPSRADELAGLLVQDVDLERRHLLFGINNPDINFTKGGTAFRIPYPPELDGLITRLIGGRSLGPLIRQISQQKPQGDSVDLVMLWQHEAVQTPSLVRTPNDRKQVFRDVIRKNGGCSGDYIGKLFAKVAKKAGFQDIQPGYCRDSATHLMEKCGMSHLSLRYLTSHSVSDILNTYTGLAIDQEIGKYYSSITDLLQVVGARFPEVQTEAPISVPA